MDVKQLTQAYIAPTYSRTPLELVRGKGSLVYDAQGNEYIDLGSGIAVNALGVADEAWQQAVIEQVLKLQHASNYYYTAPQAELAQLLCQKGGMQQVFFGNSGAEANECAIKCARKYSHDKYGEGRSTIVTLLNSFHGRTLTTLTATGQESLHAHFGPFTPGFVYVPADDLAAMEQVLKAGGVAAVMMEMIQGEGGVHVLDTAYVQAVYALCQKLDVLLIVDEVQAGNGRTGKYFSYMHFGIQPDIVSTAKAIAGGLPMGATLFGEKTKDVLTAGTHGSTYGGNPVCAAGGVSVVRRIDDALMESVAEKGAYIKQALMGSPGVQAVTGMGLMLGIKVDKDAKDVVAQCRDKGVLVLTAKDKIRLLPSLNIPMELLQKAVEVLKEVLAQ
ncbi:MAG: aspartate aminotransferase family protein [Christensenellaceae bacterium]|jgi:acetylornithine/N-succinyldiaminopimelate aminotransferase|nr:aspartate aminotransferase family protein [Christensenellaceae bacterium]